ncbi:MAG TPA: hypothetical protein VGI92_08330 [Gemmatimonadales bacterium]
MSADKGGPRDWDKELADIDKLIAAGPAVPATPPVKQGSRQAAGVARSEPAEPQSGGRLARLRYHSAFTWIRLVLAGLLGVGMTQWPYTHGCGMPLYGYLGAVGVVIVASFWSMVSSWKSRSALAHTLSIVLLFWGAALGAREVLPRTGYAKHPAVWTCTTEPVH